MTCRGLESRHWRLLILGLALGSLLAAPPSLATDVHTIPIIYAPEGTPALGGGLRLSNNPTVGDLDAVDLVPLYLYEGRYLYAHGTEFGAHLFRNETFRFGALARYRFLRIEAGDDPRLEGLEDRDQTLDGGLSAQVRGGWGQLQGEWLTDLLGRHEGEEFNLTYRFRFERGDLKLSPFITSSWQDRDLVGYYYGISAEESGPGLPAYDPGSARNFTYGLNTWYQVTDRVFLFGNVGFTSFDKTIHRSPLVDERQQVEAFIGSGYLFGSVRKQDRVPYARVGEWSYRVNAGWLVEENIFPYLMVGDWKGSSRTNTPIGGFTLGKLLSGGPRVDFHGKLALFRHFERDNQPDFWNYTAYIMAMGKGYLPWSDELAFRYGFGFGISYAERVPTVEVIKQTSKGENYARLLNYLEFQADVPIDRFVRWKPLRNCFTGVTVVHRSGIFGTSDILGNVSGGSDWVTLHLECLR
jgi:MipA family protein